MSISQIELRKLPCKNKIPYFARKEYQNHSSQINPTTNIKYTSKLIAQFT